MTYSHFLSSQTKNVLIIYFILLPIISADTTSVRTDDIGEISLCPLRYFSPGVKFIKQMLHFGMRVHLIYPETITLASQDVPIFTWN